jgi:SAM-dependent methyltransferase
MAGISRSVAMDPHLRDYWDRIGAALSFAHPLRRDWLADRSPDARILDYGCGYGRNLQALHDQGWRNALGVDFSAAMIIRGHALHPHLDLRLIDSLPLAEPNASFDAVLLFAVLTCIPRDEDQIALVAELKRLLKPGGLLYVSDYPLRSDDRNLARYRVSQPRHGVYGVWDREDGGVFRHHDTTWLHRLLSGFEELAREVIETSTMGGNAATVVQLLLRA